MGTTWEEKACKRAVRHRIFTIGNKRKRCAEASESQGGKGGNTWKQVDLTEVALETDKSVAVEW